MHIRLFKRISLLSIFMTSLTCCFGFALLLYLNEYVYNFNVYKIQSKTNHKVGDETMRNDVNNSKQTFLVDTEVCKILDVNPFDNSIKHLLNLHPFYPVCDGGKEFTYIDNHTLYINKSKSPKGVVYCHAKPIFKWKQKSLMLGTEGPKIKSSIPVTDEFLKIECFNSSGTIVAETFHMHFVHKNITREKVQNSSPKTNSDHLNVLLFLHDSVSRINSLRYMPKTRRFLLDNLGAVEMLGYNKVADNTRVNMVPLLTGEFEDNQTCLKDKQGVDNCSFIWKNFSRKGYVTHFGECWPMYGILHWNVPGFKDPPTDYYDYPFHKAEQDSEKQRFNGCFHGKSWSEVLYNRVIDLAANLKQTPYFSFTIQKRYTHNHLNGLANIDDTTRNALAKLYENNLLNNTFLAMFGDHGPRFGAVRQTVIGQLEERLPLMLIYVPGWFRQKYHIFFRNLNINSRRLTTHFDMHSTLLHLLNLDKEMPKDNPGRGISLFNKIPYDRSCQKAGILPHWCTCNYHQTSKVNSTVTKIIASALVIHLNNLLIQFNTICENLELVKIQSSFKMLSRYGQTEQYRIVIATKPGGAILESTLKYIEKTKTFKVMGDISRINLYKDQSKCIKDDKLRKYCLCKK